ncbi:16S rRNA (uracil(1498)-N(3))-methyltransferase [Candidatus Giovannonibacteria bacterium]|nr:16S rRNA (uracil(1498)-N(3))-methyltransferase [Candidatus Giovannonibacteria bacterium]
MKNSNFEFPKIKSSRRFFIGDALSNKSSLDLPEDVLRQLKTILRSKAGDKIILIDGSGFDFIAAFDGKKAVILEKIPNKCEPERKIHLFQSNLKKDKMELVFQKATELGVFKFYPILSERSVKKDFNRERAEKIIKEAVEQSGRAIIPEIHEVMDFKNALEFVQNERFKGIIADQNSKKHISEVLKTPQMAIFIGPEGGFSENEIAEMKESGFQSVFLCKTVLRGETAALVASAFLV